MDDEEIPEWEMKEEKVPPGLEEKWRRRESKGLKAGPCKGCGTLLTSEELSCPVCGRLWEDNVGFISGLASFFTTPWGILTLILIICSIITFLVYW